MTESTFVTGGAPFGMPIRIGPRDRKQQVLNQIRLQEARDTGRADERIRARTKIILGGFDE